MVHCAFSAQTPVNIIRRVRSISGSVAQVGIAKTIPTRCFATTIVVGNNVVLAIMGVIAGAYPGNGRHLGARRTTRL